MYKYYIKRVVGIILLISIFVLLGGVKPDHYSSYTYSEDANYENLIGGPKFYKDENFIFIFNYKDLKYHYERTSGKSVYGKFSPIIFMFNFVLCVSTYAGVHSRYSYSGFKVEDNTILLDRTSYGDYSLTISTSSKYIDFIIIPKWKLPKNFEYKPCTYKFKTY